MLNNKKIIVLLKKNLLLIFLMVLSLILMINFKHKKELKNFYEESKNKLLTYINNLNPLFAKTIITNEDVFNFAFYKSLPLDKEKNKVLIIKNVDDKNILEIKTSSISNTENLKSFLKLFGASKKDNIKIDSLLSAYKNKIYLNVFSGNDETYAINPDLILIRENLLADLLKISAEINYEKANKVFSYNKLKELKNAFPIPAKKMNEDFLIVTKDTIFEKRISFNKNKLEKQIKELEKSNEELDLKMKDENFNVKIDTKFKPQKENLIRYQKDSSLLKITFPNDYITNQLNDSIKKIIEYDIENIHKKIEKNKVFRKLTSTQRKIFFINPYDITNEALEVVKGINISKIVNEAILKDSSLKKYINDSIQNKKLKEELRKANKQLKIYNIDTLKY